MYGQSTYFRANVEVRFDRFSRVVRIADDEPADDEHSVAMQDLDGAHRGAAGRAAALAAGVLRLGPQERQVLIQHVLDAEEDVAEPGGLHGAAEIVAGAGKGARHPLHDVVDVVQAGGA